MGAAAAAVGLATRAARRGRLALPGVSQECATRLEHRDPLRPPPSPFTLHRVKPPSLLCPSLLLSVCCRCDRRAVVARVRREAVQCSAVQQQLTTAGWKHSGDVVRPTAHARNAQRDGRRSQWSITVGRVEVGDERVLTGCVWLFSLLMEVRRNGERVAVLLAVTVRCDLRGPGPGAEARERRGGAGSRAAVNTLRRKFQRRKPSRFNRDKWNRISMETYKQHMLALFDALVISKTDLFRKAI